MSKRHLRRVGIQMCGVSMAALCLGYSTVAFAIDEIRVTAKVREQALSDVPLSITALDSQKIELLGLQTLQDLDKFAPSLDLRTPASRRDTTITMRGLSPNTVDERLRGVSTFIDGIYISGSIASLQLQDLDRIEVIRGPQSSLFGRSTYSGAIDLVTKTPKVDKISGNVNASYSQFSVGDTPKYTTGIRVDFPIVQEKLWGSFSANLNKTDSFTSTPSGSADVGGEETTSFGAVVYAEPTENLSIKLRYMHSEDEDDQNFVHITHPDEWIAAGVDTATVGDGTIWPIGEVLDPIPGTTECEPTTDTADGAIGRGTPKECGLEQERDFLSLVVDWDIGGYTVSYLGGYYESKLDFNDDFFPRGASLGLGNDPFFGTIDPVGKSSFALIAGREEFENQSHQLRIVSPEDNRFRWLAGLYYFDEESTNFSVNNFADTDVLSRGAEITQNMAVFGQIEFDLTDQLTASLEGRYQEEEITLEQCAPDCTSPSLATNIFGREFEESESEFLPRVTLTWRPDDDNTFYALYSEGTKSARFNTRRPTGLTDEEYESVIYVEPEKLQSFEIGSKNSFLDGRLDVSTAVFYQEVEDQQRTFQLPASTVAFTDNVAESTIWGFEIEAVAEFTEGLVGNIGIGYADHEFDSEFTASSSSDRRILNGRSTKGLTSIGIPKTTINGGLQYTTPIANGDIDLTLRTDVIYRSKQYVDIANQAYIPDATRVNLSANVGTDRWSLGLFARNVFEDETATGTFSGSSTCTYRPNFTSPFQRCLGLSVNRGREIGVRGSFNF